MHVMHRRRFYPFVLLVGILLTTACTGLRRDTLPPEVSVADIALVGVTMFEQEWELTLRTRNPNDHALNLRTLDYQIMVEDRPFARGLSNEAVTLPAMGDALVRTRVTTSLFDTLRQFQAMDYTPGKPVRYRISGNARVGNVPFALPFDRRGEFVMPAL